MTEIELGRKKPNAYEVKKIAEALRVPTYKILEG